MHRFVFEPDADDVTGLDIAMDDAVLVQAIQSQGGLANQLQLVHDREPHHLVAVEDVAEQLHRIVVQLVIAVRSAAVDLHDVGMRDRDHVLPLRLEAVRVVAMRLEDLDRGDARGGPGQLVLLADRPQLFS